MDIYTVSLLAVFGGWFVGAVISIAFVLRLTR